MFIVLCSESMEEEEEEETPAPPTRSGNPWLTNKGVCVCVRARAACLYVLYVPRSPTFSSNFGGGGGLLKLFTCST